MRDNELFLKVESCPGILSKEETNLLIKKAQDGDEDALNKLVKYNLKLVLHEVYHRFQNLNYDKSDLVSLGTIGLMKAIKTFDVTKNFAFSTYATRCIDNEILMLYRKLQKIKYTKSLNDVIFILPVMEIFFWKIQ